MIPKNQYKKIIEVLPILCVDIIIKNDKNEFLLVKRANEPLKGQWWVVGGRVLKGETMEQAAIRKAKEEVSLELKSLELIGYYEEVYGENPFGVQNGLHTVSIVFLAVVDSYQQVKLDSQSSEWKYSKYLPNNFSFKTFNGKNSPLYLKAFKP
jgi:colanic acid biosynthesis protein WcaH